MKFLLLSLVVLVFVEKGISLDAFDIVDKYCAAKNQDNLRKCMTENGKSKLFTFFDTCARPLRRHVGSIKETSKFICKEANEKEDFMVRCCLAYQLRRNKDFSLPRVFETCLKRESNPTTFSHQLQQQGFISQSPVQQQESLFQSPVQFDESAEIPYIYTENI